MNIYEYFEITRLNLTDLTMYQYGAEECDPGHSYGPAVRDHFLIHYIIKGKGFFQVGNKTYHLEKGQGFLICPDVVTYYEADKEDPWHYMWVGFNGLKAETYLTQAHLNQEHPIFNGENDDEFITACFYDMMATQPQQKAREVRLLGYLYLFLSDLIELRKNTPSLRTVENRKEEYIRRAIEYIEKNFSRKVTVQELARHVRLDRSYLCSLFKEVLQLSPQGFILEYRMSKACQLMEGTSLSIGDIARSVGYEDQLLFSKMFKKIKKMTPSEYIQEKR
jgi:AraC-like DNA-binding protein